MVGPLVPKLVEYAKQQQIDLILLATHGRTGISSAQLTRRCRPPFLRRPERSTFLDRAFDVGHTLR